MIFNKASSLRNEIRRLDRSADIKLLARTATLLVVCFSNQQTLVRVGLDIREKEFLFRQLHFDIHLRSVLQALNCVLSAILIAKLRQILILIR